MALAYPNVSFRLTLDHSEKIATKGNGNLKEVISDIYGLNIARHAVKVEAEDADFKITGYAIRPEVNRSNRNYINLSVNQRHIRNFRLSQSIINAYHTLLAKDKYPVVVIDIGMDPKIVDVNVHPSKIEVRFSKEKELNALLEASVRKALQGEMLIPDVTKSSGEQKPKVEQSSIDFTKRVDQQDDGHRPHYAAEQSSVESRPNVFETEQRASYGAAEPTLQKSDSDTDGSSEPAFERNHFESAAPRQKEADTEPATEPESAVEDSPEKEKLPYLEIVGQLHGTYIILQNESGMYMMDQHAAQERIKYEFYYDHINADSDEGVPLLIPYTFEFPLDDIITIDEKLKDLHQLGFEIEKSGIKQYSVTRHPSWIDERNPEADIEQLIHFVAETEHFQVSAYREEMSIMMSCKQSIKANHYLDKKHMEALLEELGKCNSPYTCPHGRPVIIHMTTYEIERMFNRIMK